MVKNLNENISGQIKDNANLYAERIIDLHYKIKPQLVLKYNKIQKQKFLDDIKSNLNFLAAAIRIDSKELYLNYIKWLAELLKKIKIPMEEVIENFECMKKILNSEVNINYKFMINEYIDESVNYCIYIYSEKKEEDQSSIIKAKTKEFLTYLLDFEKEKATKFILDKVEGNIDIKEIYLEYFQGALYQIGELWMQGKISVAKEHYCTAVIQHIISLIYPYLFKDRFRKGKIMYSVSAGNELHEIGIRMVTDFFELDGWDTFYLGSNLPINSIIKELEERKVDILAISITMGNNIQFAADLINQVREDRLLKDIKIIVGGRAFYDTKDLWKKIGADGYGENAIESVEIGNKLVEEQNAYIVKEG